MDYHYQNVKGDLKLEVKIKIPNIKNLIVKIFNAFAFKVSNIFHFIRYKHELRQQRKYKKYQTKIIEAIDDNSLSGMFINLRLVDKLLKVDAIDKTGLRILSYNKLTKRIKVYENNYAKKILLNNGIITDLSTGIITVKKSGILETGFLTSFSYDNKKLTLHYGKNFEHTFVLTITPDSYLILVNYLKTLIINSRNLL